MLITILILVKIKSTSPSSHKTKLENKVLNSGLSHLITEILNHHAMNNFLLIINESLYILALWYVNLKNYSSKQNILKRKKLLI